MKFLPAPGLAEVVFLGRSNVGKSSLVNTLVGRKVLAPTSAVPGKTRRFVFYDVNAEKKFDDVGDALGAAVQKPKRAGRRPQFWLVDVPGAGFAVDQHTGDASALSTKVESWKALTCRYLDVRDTLRVVVQLVDSRRLVDGGIDPTDQELLALVAKSQAVRSKGAPVPTTTLVIRLKARGTSSR
ncbi:hypothetical protein M885DRAFT_498937 [Pelagophyceae sp. CCMP2097]|nr:hypothetical protein M885DRAFT_498937 [Pelagophyceae sp. CCMP2097]